MVNEISTKSLTVNQVQNRENVVELKLANTGKKETEAFTEKSESKDSDITRQVTETANRLNQIAQNIDRDLSFTVDNDSGDVVITVTDSQSQEVIRQIPEEHVLAIRENIETLKGILFSAKI